jgi:hypothetical protein
MQTRKMKLMLSIGLSLSDSAQPFAKPLAKLFAPIHLAVAISPRRKFVMVVRTHFITACFSLIAGFGCIPGALAQDRPSSPQPEVAGHSTVVDVSGSINWNEYKWIERRYKIEAIRFRARRETGIGWWGSDEVMVGTEDAKGNTVSEEIDGIDSGDTHYFDPAKSCIVAVRPGKVVLGKTSVCEQVGEPAPLGFHVEFWEKDDGPGANFCVPGNGGPGFHYGPYCANDGNGDDFIGSAQIDYSSQQLEAALPNVGGELLESVTLDPCPGQICGSGPGPWRLPDYTFTWRVTRLPDVQVDLAVTLKEAMQRSGSRSELEAIVSGLRYLRELHPHKIEPESGKQ